jgi:hypothetical protein
MGTISGRFVLHNRQHCVSRCTLRKMHRPSSGGVYCVHEGDYCKICWQKMYTESENSSFMSWKVHCNYNDCHGVKLWIIVSLHIWDMHLDVTTTRKKPSCPSVKKWLSNHSLLHDETVTGQLFDCNYVLSTYPRLVQLQNMQSLHDMTSETNVWQYQDW